jgi:hypothetical protein
MKIIYSRHAKQRMTKRKVTHSQIVETLDMPDDIQEGDFDEQIAIKRYGNREIRVVYKEIAQDEYFIITVIFPRITKIKR